MKTDLSEITRSSTPLHLVRAALALGVLSLASAPAWALRSGEAASPAETVTSPESIAPQVTAQVEGAGSPSLETTVQWELMPSTSITLQSDGSQGTSSAALGIRLAPGMELAASTSRCFAGGQPIGESTLRLDTSLGATQLSLQETRTSASGEASRRREAILSGELGGLRVDARYTVEGSSGMSQRTATLGLHGQLSPQGEWEVSHSRGTALGSGQHATSIAFTQALTDSDTHRVSVNGGYTIGDDGSTHGRSYQVGVEFSKPI